MSAEPGPVARALLDVAGDGSDHELAGRVCHACVAGTSVDGAAVSLLTTTVHRETLFATDRTAATLEDLQFTLGEGACVEAARSGRPVLVPDLYDPHLCTLWPVFATAVIEQTDVRALFAIPLQLGTINLGVLDLYRTEPGPLDGSELRDVLSAVHTATLMLLGAEWRADPGWQLDTVPHGGKTASRDGLSDDRAEIHQATGMLVAQLDVSSQNAFARLRAYAFAHRRPLGEVAGDVVGRRLVFTQDME